MNIMKGDYMGKKCSLPVFVSVQHIDGITTLYAVERNKLLAATVGHIDDHSCDYVDDPDLKENHTKEVQDFMEVTDAITLRDTCCYVDRSFSSPNWTVIMSVHPNSISTIRNAKIAE